mmetsp:Transcript_13342/g.33855  ORF Transcript_13342/g.33855 Transcript_13342/m.33855 type:complete len:240 (+) Transcript_13342:1-720(+)
MSPSHHLSLPPPPRPPHAFLCLPFFLRGAPQARHRGPPHRRRRPCRRRGPSRGPSRRRFHRDPRRHPRRQGLRLGRTTRAAAAADTPQARGDRPLEQRLPDRLLLLLHALRLQLRLVHLVAQHRHHRLPRLRPLRRQHRRVHRHQHHRQAPRPRRHPHVVDAPRRVLPHGLAVAQQLAPHRGLRHLHRALADLFAPRAAGSAQGDVRADAGRAGAVYAGVCRERGPGRDGDREERGFVR